MTEDLTLAASVANIVAVPIAVLAILVAVVIYLRSRQRRRLLITINKLEFPVVIAAGPGLEGDIKINYRGEALVNLFILRGEIKNVGNLAIRREHVLRPITFQFDPGSEFVREPLTYHTSPAELPFDWRMSSQTDSQHFDRVELGFELLNPGSEVAFQFLCTGPAREPRVGGLVEGVRQLELSSPEALQASRPKRALIFGIAFFAMGLLSLELSDQLAIADSRALKLYGALFIFLGLIMLSELLSRNGRKWLRSLLKGGL